MGNFPAWFVLEAIPIRYEYKKECEGLADEKIKEVISNLEREITEQMTALNVRHQKIREITVHLEKQSKQLKSLNESLDAQLKAPGQAGKTSQELDAAGEAPTTRMDTLISDAII